MSSEVVRGRRGEWFVATDLEPFGYGTVGETRRLVRIPVGPDATRERAVEAAREAGLLDEDE